MKGWAQMNMMAGEICNNDKHLPKFHQISYNQRPDHPMEKMSDKECRSDMEAENSFQKAHTDLLDKYQYIWSCDIDRPDIQNKRTPDIEN